jgi:hypothetical protein
VNAPFKFPFIHGLISTLHAKSINPRGALYAFTNCPCLIFCPRGVVQLNLVDRGVWVTSGCVVVGELLVHRLFVGCSVVLICH